MNWGELKQAVAAYLHRGDISGLMPTFLELTEQRIYYGEQGSDALRVSHMLQTVTLAAPGLPADFLQAKRVMSGDVILNYRPAFELPRQVRSFANENGALLLSSDMDWPIDLVYWARFAPLVLDADTNWLLTNAPNVYLTSMLVDAARWSRDNDLGAREAANYQSAINNCMAADKTASASGSLLTQRIPR